MIGLESSGDTTLNGDLALIKVVGHTPARLGKGEAKVRAAMLSAVELYLAGQV